MVYSNLQSTVSMAAVRIFILAGLLFKAAYSGLTPGLLPAAAYSGLTAGPLTCYEGWVEGGGEAGLNNFTQTPCTEHQV